MSDESLAILVAVDDRTDYTMSIAVLVKERDPYAMRARHT